MSGMKYGNRKIKDYGVIDRGKGRRYMITLHVYTSKYGQYPYYVIQEEWQDMKTQKWFNYRLSNGKKLWKSISIPVKLVSGFITFLSSLDTDADQHDNVIHEDIRESKTVLDSLDEVTGSKDPF